MSPIVAAVDFSAGSDRALALAAQIAAATGAPLHLMHADVLFRASGDGAPPEDVPSGAARLRLERLTEDLALPAATVVVERHTSAAGAVLGYVADVRARLLVMGTHGRTGVRRLLLGSVAEACVAGAPCPVLTVPDDAHAGPGPDAPVLVAVDFSERSAAALAAGRALAAWTGAALELAHVARGFSPMGLPPVPGLLADSDAAAAPAAEQRLRRFAESAPGPAPDAVHAAVGPPERTIAALALARGAGAVVVGTHGRSGPARLVGSVAAATLRRAPCPVLTVTVPAGDGLAARPVRSALA